ncbi:MAG: winged helix-turn-helix domain-containing protein [Acidimicrobiaceae bacterium]|nr:winged helix DNA-binding domain-containing protein [Acidimicrobiaceae bacterium]MCY3643968.1 winged helix DNA-binding domain-containing protein [Acidimicrobiaceae bacterium]MDE0664990.1 winged helix DNA-binding domain-containing protein [Acidimicrobiaceae bacterium]MXW89238.1 winged helix-turn-helix domain-containing protein [Acidimicrobiaceae bacterium]MYE56073.1 winged helix-turn-helix domain-containing protein [Acidimicrobiaceae bacterium]
MSPQSGRELSVSQARRIALAAQGFTDSAPAGRVDRRHLRRVMGRLKLLQLDSVPVVVRTQYLPPFSRLGCYDPALLDRIAYTDDEWFEAWAHEASLLPVGDEPLLRWQKQRAEQGDTWKNLVELAHRESQYVAEVLAQVAERPLTAGELTDPRRRDGEWWGSRSLGSIALDWLFRIGAVGIRRRGNFTKEFDLLERIVPAAVLARPTPSAGEAQRELLVRSAEALGVGSATDLIDYYRLPVREGRTQLREVVDSGLLAEVAVEGWTEPAYMHPGARLPRSVDALTVLSPFDPIVWNRDRAARLWNFDYRIEIYVPAAKRVYGYYVLPVLDGEQLVARLDVKTDRPGGTLRVLGAFAEPGVDHGALAERLRPHLHDLARFVGVDDVGYGDRGDLMAALDPG